MNEVSVLRSSKFMSLKVRWRIYSQLIISNHKNVYNKSNSHINDETYVLMVVMVTNVKNICFDGSSGN